MRITFFLILLLVFVSAWSQSPTFRHYGMDDGLASLEVYHVFQDSKGYIWFATNNGVSRFDGKSFQNYSVQNGLPSNTVFEIYEDPKSRIWFITFSCQFAYLIDGEIHKYKYNHIIQELDDVLPNPLKCSFQVDSLDNLSFGSKNIGFIEINNKGEIQVNTMEHHDKVIFKKNDRILCSVKNYKELIVDNLIFNRSFHSKINQKEINTSGAIRVEEYKGNVLFSLGRVLISFMKDKEDYEILFDRKIIWMKKDNHNSLWIGFQKGGAKCYNTSEIKNETYHFLKDHSVSSMIVDHSGGFWFTTLEDGVFYTPSIDILSISGEKDLNGLKVSTFLVKDDKLMIAGNDPTIYIYEKDKIASFTLEENPDLFVNRLKEIDDIIYVCCNLSRTIASGIKVVDYEEHMNNDFALLWANDIYEESKENLYIVGTYGLLNIKNGYANLLDFQRIRSDVLLEENQNEFWVGTIKGLFKINTEEKDYHFYGQIHPLLKARILDILKLDKTLVLATKGYGIVFINGDDIYRLSTDERLINSTVNSICFDDGVLWAATNDGLLRIENYSKKDSIQIFEINRKHGLPAKKVNQVEIKDSIVYLATEKGVSFFNKYKLNPSHYIPQIYISEILVNEVQVDIHSDLSFDYNKNSVTISFNSMNYKCSGDVNYKYMLEGIDKNWIIDNTNTVRYPSLNPGKYKFLVYAMNEDGYWSEEPAMIEFEIQSPYWKDPWFYVLIIICGLLIVGLIVLAFYRLRIRSMRNQMDLRNELNLSRQKALAQQMNPHFLFNSLNSIQYFIYQNDKEKSNDYLSKFSLLLRLILDNSQKQAVSLGKELQAIELYLELESLRFRDDFIFSIEVDPNVDVDYINIPALIIQPFVENALWHGLMHKIEGEKKLKVQIQFSEQVLECIIEDNGIGREKSKEINTKRKKYESLGTRITQNRLQLINSLYGDQLNLKFIDLYNEGNPSGTKVIINLPIVKAIEDE